MNIPSVDTEQIMPDQTTPESATTCPKPAPTPDWLKPVVPPVIERLLTHPAAQPVSEDTLEAFLAQPGEAILFLWSYPARHPEVLDVAVVLPELVAHFARQGVQFRVGVVDEASERALGTRYAMMSRPALVFLRNGQFVSTIHGVQNWRVYLDFIHKILATQPQPPPRGALSSRFFRS